MGSKQGYYIPLPLQHHCPRCFTKFEQKCYTSIASVFHKIEQKWMCQLHGILQLPRSLFRSVVLPLHLYLPYGSVPEHCDLPV